MSTYTGKDIQVLEGLEPVRKRPGMYIGGTGKAGLHHLLWEIVDNAVDEATNGYASFIEVVLHADGQSATVTDNGRGIPVDLHPVKKIPTLELILTTLHAGGKFDNTNYITSGGLHGVGSSVVNALSEELIARVKRDGALYEQRFARGVPVSKLKKIKTSVRGTGTSIFFRPDPEIFETTRFDPELIAERLEIKTFLNRGLKIVFKNETTGNTHEYQHEGGILAYLDRIRNELKARPIHPEPFTLKLDTLAENGCRAEIVLQWTEHTREHIRSFVNGIPTQDGGTHEQGFREGIVRALRSYMETHNTIDRKLDISADDIREGVLGIINLFMVDPQFQGQTKEKLNNPEIRSYIGTALRTELEHYLNTHPSAADAILTRIVQAARARLASRAAARQARRKSSISHRLNLPGKLADCSSTNPEECEIFIVEGDSAGGSAKQARDRKTQAILPLRGKVLNAEQASQKRVLENKELNNVIQALGCGIGKDLDLSKLRYHKVILLMDADSDGHHITTLLLTFFYRYMRPLIEEGYVYLAQPPLYRINVGKETYWALDDEEKDRILKPFLAQRKKPSIEIQRFKGLGEMMPQTLKETTLDPQRRRLLQVSIPDTERMLTEQTITQLMGKDTSARYAFIMHHATEVDDLDV